MTPESTIVAIATPLGVGGLGVVRLSGPAAIEIADHVFSKPHGSLRSSSTHTLHYGQIKKDNDVVDAVVASLFIAPHSYTGEDVVEFSCHGNPHVLKEVVNLCVQAGALHAEPGEFTQRAYLNGKLDLLQAEAVAELIHASSQKARQAAQSQLDGNLSMRIGKIRQALIDLLARLEANLDFVEEDIPGLPRKQMEENLKRIQEQVDRLLQTSLTGKILREGIRVVIVGKPNVGKSSLFNAILAQDRAIVSNIPGTTRDTLEEKISWAGISVVLTDTAGLRKTQSPIEQLGTARAQTAQELADVVLLVFDSSEKLTPQDKKIFDETKNKKRILVFNKVDRGERINLDNVMNDCIVRTSAIQNEGLESLKEAIVQVAAGLAPEVEDGVVITNMRHADHLRAASEKIQKALNGCDKNLSEEAISVDVRYALSDLGAITGEEITEDVLTSIFRQFCIGK